MAMAWRSSLTPADGVNLVGAEQARSKTKAILFSFVNLFTFLSKNYFLNICIDVPVMVLAHSFIGSHSYILGTADPVKHLLGAKYSSQRDLSSSPAPGVLECILLAKFWQRLPKELFAINKAELLKIFVIFLDWCCR